MNNMRFATTRYSGIQGLYWISYCMTMNFAAVYLLSKSFSNSEIGIVLALVNILAVFLQPAMAAFIDRTSKISLKNFISLLVGIILILSFFLLLTSNNKLITSLLMVTAFSILVSLQPMVNSICFRYEKYGVRINFGIARGIGSGAYAVISIILGNVIAKFGSELLPVYYITALLLLLTILYTFIPHSPVDAQPHSYEHKNDSEMKAEKQVTESTADFVKRYKNFLFFAVGSALVLFPHGLINTFTIQIVNSLGGKSAQMGTASFIAAMAELPVMFAFSKLKEKISCAALLKIAAVVFTVKHLITYLAVSIPMFYMSQLLQFGAYGLFIPASVYYAGQVIDKKDQVKGQAIVTAAITLGFILSSLIGGILLDITNAKTMLFTGFIVSIIGTTIMLFATSAPKIRN